MAIQIKEIFSVQNMVCSGCEALIENALRSVPGVLEVQANFTEHTVTVSYDPDWVSLKKIQSVVRDAGYPTEKAVSNSPKEPAGKKTASAFPFLGIVVVLLALYLIFGGTLSASFLPQINSSMSYGMLFVVGLLTSLHCVAMCGGISMTQCISGNTEASARPNVRQSLLYNLGRVTSYTIIGGVIGDIGSVISLSGWARGMIPIVSGICMVIMGLSMTGRFPQLNKFVPRMPKSLREKAGAAGKGKGPFIIGLLNGLMPCGPLQAMQAYALGTGSAISGALSMFFFSIGTLPLMFGFGAVVSMLGQKFQKKMVKISAVFVAVLGVILVGRGFALSGLALPATAASSSASSAAKTEISAAGDVQNITTTLSAGGYPSFSVQKGIPVVWNLKADENSLNGCNQAIIIPEYNLQVKLQPGDNIIKFTPGESGTIPYSCWMGMIRSQIDVVDDLSNVQTAPDESADAWGSAAPPQMPCCTTFQ